MKARSVIAVLAAAGLLAACGGGGGGSDRVTAVKVVGASLADTGTFGFKFTVQSATPGQSFRVYPEWVAEAYNLPALCSAYVATGPASFAFQPACTNHAVAGSGINFGRFTDTNSDTVNDTFTALPAVPASQLFQLQTLGSQGFGQGDLLIVGEGSANDTANLVTAYLTDVQTAGTLNTTLFRQVITSVMKDGGVTAGAGVAAPDQGLSAGTIYMQELAKALVASVRANALDKNARRVLILNTLDVTRTPRFEATLAGIAASGPSGPAQAAAVRGLVQTWINAYNTALANEIESLQGRVELFDAFTVFNALFDEPEEFGLTNLAQTVCDETNAQANTYTPTLTTAGNTSLNDAGVRASCTDTNASSITPSVGTGTDWWTTYLFSDNFHPTPLGHEVLGDEINDRLRQLGWL